MAQPIQPMTVYGFTITPHVIDQVERKMREQAFTAGAMTLAAKGICFVELGSDAPAHRLVDRLIQRHRKAGTLTKSSGGGHTRWTWAGTA